MPKITAFEELTCWKESRILVKKIYSTTQKPPFSKDFGLRDQIQRAYISKEEAEVLREQATSCQRLVLGLIKHFNKQ